RLNRAEQRSSKVKPHIAYQVSSRGVSVIDTCTKEGASLVLSGHLIDHGWLSNKSVPFSRDEQNNGFVQKI
ncbi:hypothetical protein ACFVW2_38090, partial [Streptomyces sp. NPDC058171]